MSTLLTKTMSTEVLTFKNHANKSDAIRLSDMSPRLPTLGVARALLRVFRVTQADAV